MVEPSFSIFSIERRLSLACRRSHLRWLPIERNHQPSCVTRTDAQYWSHEHGIGKPAERTPTAPHSAVRHLSARAGRTMSSVLPGLGDALVTADHLGDDEGEELIGEFGVE